MGWYDAFKGDTTSASKLAIQALDGSGAAKNFGDAFKDIGKTMYDAKMDEEKSAVLDLQAKNEQMKYDNATELKTQTKLDDAFKKDFNFNKDTDYQKSLLEFEKPDGTFDSNISNSALEYAQKKITDNTNNNAVINAVSTDVGKDNGVKLAEWIKNNPNADSETVLKVKTMINSDDTTATSLKAAKASADNARAMLKMQERLNVATDKSAKNGAGGFKYDENTDAKIAAQVKSALGMDTPDFTMSDKVKVEYQNAVAGSAKISKAYNLEPSLAIHVYRNPDLYEIKDGTVYEKPQAKEEPETKINPSWKDYMNKK